MSILQTIFPGKRDKPEEGSRLRDRLSFTFNHRAKEVLDNGFHAWITKKLDSDTAHIRLKINSGAMDDPPGKEGLAHLLEHMVFAQNDQIIDEWKKGSFARKGGSDNGYTHLHETVYTASIPDNFSNRKKMLGLMVGAVFSPRFDPEQLEREKKVILNEIAMIKDQERYNLVEQITPAAFGGPSQSQSILGSADSLANITVEDLYEFHRKHYTPANAILEVGSPATAVGLLGQIKKAFGKLPPGSLPEREHPAITYKGGLRHIDDPQAEQTGFAVAFPCQTESDEANASASVLGQYITLALKDELRGKDDRIIYHAESGSFSSRGESIFAVTASCLPEDARQLLPATAKILTDIAAGDIDPERLKTAQAQILKENENIRQSRRSAPLGSHYFKSDEATAQTCKKAINHVKAKDLQNLVAGHLLSAPPTLVTKGDTSAMQSYEQFADMLGIQLPASRKDEKETPHTTELPRAIT